MSFSNCNDEILQAIHDLPDDANIEDAMERLYLRLKIERGLQQADSNRKISQEEARQRMFPRAEVTWTEQALEDLDAICLFIARDSCGIADGFASPVLASADQLGALQLSGRVVPEVGRDEIREILVQRCRIIYRVLSDAKVEILTLHDGDRPVRNL